MKTREFDRHDWDAFEGAEGWSDHPPLIAEGELEDGMGYALVLDRNGACLVLDDEQAQYGGYALRRAFAGPDEARAFAESLGEPKMKGEFILAGFREV